MSDDLVKRLRDLTSLVARTMPPAWREQCELCSGSADLIEELEAKLEKALEALEFYATQDVTYPNVGTVTFHGHDDNGCKARTTLAELTGGKDDRQR